MIILILISFIAGLGLALNTEKKKLEAERQTRNEYQTKARLLVRAIASSEPFFACPECAAVSYSLADIENGYCKMCQKQTRKAYEMDYTEAA